MARAKVLPPAISRTSIVSRVAGRRLAITTCGVCAPPPQYTPSGQ